MATKKTSIEKESSETVKVLVSLQDFQKNRQTNFFPFSNFDRYSVICIKITDTIMVPIIIV